jgi:hypothetical protein
MNSETEWSWACSPSVVLVANGTQYTRSYVINTLLTAVRVLVPGPGPGSFGLRPVHMARCRWLGCGHLSSTVKEYTRI